MNPMFQALLTLWAVTATVAAVTLSLIVASLQRRIKYLEAVTQQDWETVDRMMGITSDRLNQVSETTP